VDITLLTDGSGDKRLLPIIRWAVADFADAVNATWADFRFLREPPRTLRDRVRASVELYRCDVLFIHRDAETRPLATAQHEIDAACHDLDELPPFVRVVPVRMQEAWLLFDEQAIRTASGNPSGRANLDLPRVRRLEEVADPKARLYEALRTASETSGRRLKKFRAEEAAYRVAELVADFSELRVLPAFRAFETDVARAVRAT
jgi:hypothetical protein